jgi:hypothetical protein
VLFLHSYIAASILVKPKKNKVGCVLDKGYSLDRPQWDLLKLAPAEYYQYLMTGEYPLEKIQNKANGEE